MIERRWTHAGLECAVLMHDQLGHRCGYVRVPEDHPWFGLDYDDEVPNPICGRIDDRSVDDVGVIAAFAAMNDVRGFERRMIGQVAVHGGLTYARDYLPLSEKREGWWIGFDTGHAGDTPDYWTEERVAEEVERLAEQVAEMAVTP